MVTGMFSLEKGRYAGFANIHHSLPSRRVDQPILRQLAKSWFLHALSRVCVFRCQGLWFARYMWGLNFFGGLKRMVNEKRKRVQISFRLTELAWERLKQAAELFNMEPSTYAKAVLYRDLGLFKEPVDQRSRRWRKKQRKAS